MTAWAVAWLLAASSARGGAELQQGPEVRILWPHAGARTTSPVLVRLELGATEEPFEFAANARICTSLGEAESLLGGASTPSKASTCVAVAPGQRIPPLATAKVGKQILRAWLVGGAAAEIEITLVADHFMAHGTDGVDDGEDDCRAAGDVPARRREPWRTRAHVDEYARLARPLQLGFVHVPKCGGSSLWALLARAAVAEKLDVQPSVSVPIDALEAPLDVVGAGHLSWFQLQGTWAARAARPPRLYVTLIRDPRSRIVSLYRFILGFDWMASGQACAGNAFVGCERVSKGTFADFVGNTSDGDMTRAFLVDGQARSLSGLDVERAKATLLHGFSVVGILEDQQRTMDVLRCRVPWLRGSTAPKFVDHILQGSAFHDYPDVETVPNHIWDHSTRLDSDLYHYAKSLLRVDHDLCQ